MTALYHKDKAIMFLTLEKGTPQQIVNHKTTPEIFRPFSDRIEVITWEIRSGNKLVPKAPLEPQEPVLIETTDDESSS